MSRLTGKSLNLDKLDRLFHRRRGLTPLPPYSTGILRLTRATQAFHALSGSPLMVPVAALA